MEKNNARPNTRAMFDVENFINKCKHVVNSFVYQDVLFGKFTPEEMLKQILIIKNIQEEKEALKFLVHNGLCDKNQNPNVVNILNYVQNIQCPIFIMDDYSADYKTIYLGKIYDEENFAINLPLLSSSLFSDAEYSKSEINENNEIVITDKMLERLEFLEELARLQMIEDYVIYTCSAKNVEGKTIYYKETNYDNIDPTTVKEGECNESTVDMIFKEKLVQFNEDEYFIRLEESQILDDVYSDYFESDSLLVSKIKNQYYIFNTLNLIDTDDEDYAPVPMELLYDSNVNLQSPLKGWYSITSPFGMRDGEYAGMHTGIDLVANDKNIYAAGTGIVTRSNVEREGGNVVEITHTASDGRQYVSQYAHLSQRLVSVGDEVNSGDIIGIMGDTGTMASGVHLHFAMWLKQPYELLNPKILFDNSSN